MAFISVGIHSFANDENAVDDLVDKDGEYPVNNMARKATRIITQWKVEVWQLWSSILIVVTDPFLARGEEKESSGVKVYGNAGLNRTYKQIKWEPVVTLIYLW